MLDLIGKQVVVQTALGKFKGTVLFYNGSTKITIASDNATQQITASSMVITITEQ